MRFIADLHIHSRYSRATSSDLTPENLWLWGQRKGLNVIGAGDFRDDTVVENFFMCSRSSWLISTSSELGMKQKKIFEYVEAYCNRKRAHSTLRFLIPFGYEKQRGLFLQDIY